MFYLLNMKNLLPITVLLCLSVACSHDMDKQRLVKSGVPAQHGGQILKGDGYYLEVVGSADKVEIYPLKKDKATGTFIPIPLKQIDLDASYSYLSNEKNAGENNRPTQKAEATIPLHPEGSALVGNVRATDVTAYSLIIKTDYQDEKERFVHKVDLWAWRIR